MSKSIEANATYEQRSAQYEALRAIPASEWNIREHTQLIAIERDYPETFAQFCADAWERENDL